MSIDRLKWAVPGVFLFLVGCGSDGSGGSGGGNIITGEGIPNPFPVVTNQWGELPAGRAWGHTAGIDIDPTDGHIWAYERCGAGGGSAGPADGAVNCDTNPVDPIFKFDRNTGQVLVNFGGGIFQTPHGIHVDSDGNVWVTDHGVEPGNGKGHQVFKFSSRGRELMTLGQAGVPGEGRGYTSPF